MLKTMYQLTFTWASVNFITNSRDQYFCKAYVKFYPLPLLYSLYAHKKATHEYILPIIMYSLVTSSVKIPSTRANKLVKTLICPHLGI